MDLTLRVWRQPGPAAPGRFEEYAAALGVDLPELPIERAVAAVPLLILPQILFSEFAIPRSQFGRLTETIEHFMIVKWGYRVFEQAAAAEPDHVKIVLALWALVLMSVLLLGATRQYAQCLTRGPLSLRQQATVDFVELRDMLRLFDQAIFWDLGAGSGSVAVEAAAVIPAGAVIGGGGGNAGCGRCHQPGLKRFRPRLFDAERHRIHENAWNPAADHFIVIIRPITATV